MAPCTGHKHLPEKPSAAEDWKKQQPSDGMHQDSEGMEQMCLTETQHRVLHYYAMEKHKDGGGVG